MLERKEIRLFEEVENLIGVNNEWYNRKYEQELEYVIDNNIDNIEKLEVITTTKEGYKVVKCTVDLANAGAPIACAVKISGITDKYIVIDDLFYKLSTMAKQFVLTHEIAHLKFGHLDGLGDEGGILDDIEKEIEADGLAVKLFGKEVTIKSLKEVTRLVVSIIDKENVDTVKHLCEIMERRIEAIRNR